MNKIRRATVGLAALSAIATSLLVGAPAAHADSAGCNNGICVRAVGNGSYVRNTYAYISSLRQPPSFYGFYRVFGPDYNKTSETKTWTTSFVFSVPVGRNYPNGAGHCIEAWEKVGSDFRLISRPCVYNPI